MHSPETHVVLPRQALQPRNLQDPPVSFWQKPRPSTAPLAFRLLPLVPLPAAPATTQTPASFAQRPWPQRQRPPVHTTSPRQASQPRNLQDPPVSFKQAPLSGALAALWLVPLLGALAESLLLASLWLVSGLDTLAVSLWLVSFPPPWWSGALQMPSSVAHRPWLQWQRPPVHTVSPRQAPQGRTLQPPPVSVWQLSPSTAPAASQTPSLVEQRPWLQRQLWLEHVVSPCQASQPKI
mmetsp:Transcript_28648/g.89059  ORF Transcript_28648/g.89059 Transcript_28648/m.89059 type:complete len:237 (-) Transcript_28648:177-887(-)